MDPQRKPMTAREELASILSDDTELLNAVASLNDEDAILQREAEGIYEQIGEGGI